MWKAEHKCLAIYRAISDDSDEEDIPPGWERIGRQWRHKKSLTTVSLLSDVYAYEANADVGRVVDALIKRLEDEEKDRNEAEPVPTDVSALLQRNSSPLSLPPEKGSIVYVKTRKDSTLVSVKVVDTVTRGVHPDTETYIRGTEVKTNGDIVFLKRNVFEPDKNITIKLKGQPLLYKRSTKRSDLQDVKLKLQGVTDHGRRKMDALLLLSDFPPKELLLTGDPPAEWKKVQVGDKINVDVQTDASPSSYSETATVTSVFNSVFKARIEANDPWEDWFTWDEEDKDWRRVPDGRAK